MNLMNGILSIAFFSLVFLSYIDMVNITEYHIFGLTIGAIFISISNCFEFEDKKNIHYYIKIVFIILGWISIIDIGVLKIPILDDVIDRFNSNMLLFLSLGYTLVGNIVNDIANKNKLLKTEEKIRKEYNEKIDNLEGVIKSIKKN